MKKNIVYSFLITILLIVSCGPMDETYRDFIKDGPKLYLTRVSKDSLIIRNGWNRVLISYPDVADKRSTKVMLVLNATDTLTYDLEKTKRTDILLENMKEGSVIYTTWLEDNHQNRSLPTDFTGTIYGEQYQNYLINRSYKNKSVSSSGHLIIKYNMLFDDLMIASEFIWKNNEGIETSKISYYKENANESDTLFNFGGDSFEMRTLYIPEENALDSIWSKWKTITTD